MPTDEPAGDEAEAFTPSPEAFDETFERYAEGKVIHELFDREMGPFPPNVEPFSLVTREGLDRVFAELRLQQDDHLVDLCCGRGGIGLWFAMESGARLTGVDFSPTGDRRGRTPRRAVPPGRSRSFCGRKRERHFARPGQRRCHPLHRRSADAPRPRSRPAGGRRPSSR